MTWVVGTTSPFGYGVLISDVRVTLRDKSERDMLLKVHPVAPFIVCGFAGSVSIGFELIAALEKALHLPEHLLKANCAWYPAFVADRLPLLAKEIFRSAPKYEQELGSQLLLVGASPTENLGDAPFPRVYLVRFASPILTPDICGAVFGRATLATAAKQRSLDLPWTIILIWAPQRL